MATNRSRQKDNHSSDWAFNLRTRQLHDSDDSDDSEEPDEPTSNRVSDDSQLMNDLDLSTRAETVNYKPNPWTIAKVNAASRPSEKEKPIPSISSKSVSSKEQPTGSIVDGFKKQAARFKLALGVAASKPGTATHRTLDAPRGSSNPKPGPTTLNFPVIIANRTRQSQISSTQRASRPPGVKNTHTSTSELLQHDPVADISTPHARKPVKSKVFPQSFSSPTQRQGDQRITNRVNATSYSSPAVPVNKSTIVSGHTFSGVPLHHQYPRRPPMDFLSSHRTSTSELRQLPDTLLIRNTPVPDFADHSIFHDRHHQLPVDDRSRSSMHHHTGTKASGVKPLPTWLVSALPPQDEHRNDLQDDLPPSSPIQSSPPSRASDAAKKYVPPSPTASSVQTKENTRTTSPIVIPNHKSCPSSPPSKYVSTSPRLQKRKDPYATEDPDPDETWSTLPARKKGKPAQSLKTGIKTSGMFRLPINLGGKAKSPIRSGMSATSKRRVVTFLPPPLVVNNSVDDARKNDSEVRASVAGPTSREHEETGKSNQARQEPQLSPVSPDQRPDTDLGLGYHHPVHQAFSLTLRSLDGSGPDVIEPIHDLPASQAPSTNSPLLEDVNMVADTAAIVKNYPRTKLLIRERKRACADGWERLGLPSCGMVHQDSVAVDVKKYELPIMVWSMSDSDIS